MDQDEGYPDHGSQYGLDPSFHKDPQWPLYQTQIAQHNEQFTVPHSTPLGTASAQRYQPYVDPPSSYGNYGNPRESNYPVPSYLGDYSSIYQPSNLLHMYSAPQHGVAQTHPVAQQPFSSLNQPSSYTQAFRPDDRTISPQVLERVDSNITSRSSFQPWERGVLAGHEHQGAVTAASQINQYSSSVSSAREHNILSLGGGDTGPPVEISSQVRDVPRSTPSRRSATILPQSTLWITHPELLRATENIPSRRIKSAPFIVLDELPKSLDSDIKSKTSVSKAVRDNDKQPFETGSGKPGASVGLSTSSTKVRSRPMKSGPHMGLAYSRSKPKSLSSTGRTSPPSSSSSDAESDSGDESSADERPPAIDMLQQITDLRPATRPADVVAAASWDAIGSIFSPNNRHTTTDEIIKGTQEFGKLFLDLRDNLVLISTDLVKAEEEKRMEDVKRLKDARALKRKAITSAVQAVIKFGKAVILNNFGRSPKLINGFINVLRDCVKYKDLDGELPKALLKMLSRCGFITDELLQKAKFEQVEKRLLSNNDAEVKDYIKTIRANTVDSREQAKESEQSTRAKNNKAQVATQDVLKSGKLTETSKATSTSSGLKRAIDTDSTSGKPNKKVAYASTGADASQKPVATRPRAPGLFDYRKSAVPKPTAAAKAPNVPVSTPAPVRKRESTPEPMQTPRAPLMEILESIANGPADTPQVHAAPPKLPETLEEKARRERKESRRHLRVHWKEDSALKEIRLFQHEQAEDEGRQENMLLDAHDDRSEGMMLKNRVLDTMTDEEDEGAAEVDYRPYPPDLKSIDLSILGEDVREKSYVTRGGKMLPNTSQKQIQDQRESLELMVVYTDPKDIPFSPKEPPVAHHVEMSSDRFFGQPTAPWLCTRLRSIVQYGHKIALSDFVRRFEREQGRPIYSDPTQTANTTPDISTTLTSVSSSPQHQNSAVYQISHQPQMAGHQPSNQEFVNPFRNPNVSRPAPVHTEEYLKEVNRVYANLLPMIEPVMGKAYPATEPPAWMTERAKNEWWVGFYRDRETKQKVAHKAEKEAAITQNVQALTPAPTHQPQPTLLGSYLVPPPPQSGSHSLPQLSQIQLTQPGSYSVPQPPQMQSSQLGSYSSPLAPSVTTSAMPSLGVGKLQEILTSLNNGGNNTISSQLQNIFSSLNVPNNQAVVQQQQNWSGGWPSTSGGNNTTQLYPSQSQPSRWENSHNSATGTSRSSYIENSRLSYDTSNLDQANHRVRDGVYGNEDRPRVPVPTAVSEYKGKKKPCKFWQEGKCAKGANCTFLHD